MAVKTMVSEARLTVVLISFVTLRKLLAPAVLRFPRLLR